LVLKGTALGLVGVTVIATAIFSFSRSVSADSISSEKAYAAELVAQIQQENNKISQLNESFDQAQIRLQQIDAQIKTNKAAVSRSDNAVQGDMVTLRNEALDEYMSGGSQSGIAQLFSGAGTSQSNAQEYQNLAGGDISSLIDQLHVDQQSLQVQRNQLNSAESQQRSTIALLNSERAQAQQEEQQLTETLSQVRGRIATLVHQQQVAEQQAQEAAFLAQVQRARAAQLLAEQQAAAEAAAAAAAAAQAAQAQQPALSTTPTSTTTTTSSPPPSAGSAGAAAVQAAESQEGVPYVWGGATPGVGFDCSGLTMWAWGQAGVSLPHSAADQMAVTTPVPLSDLQPGDLLFYYDGPGYVGHVTMYVGPGEMIQAEETGTNVMITPIWNTNLAGAGRP
jgi:cell wall-associated NlpC family hydrolase